MTTAPRQRQAMVVVACCKCRYRMHACTSMWNNMPACWVVFASLRVSQAHQFAFFFVRSIGTIRRLNSATISSSVRCTWP